MDTTSRHKIPRLALGLLALSPSAFAAAGCDIHDGKFEDEFNAGGIDPFNFPPPYRGTGAVRQTAASGVFTETRAYVKGKPVGYFAFPFAPSQVPTTSYPAPSAASWPGGVIDPLRVSGPGTDFRKAAGNPVPVPLVYNFGPPECRPPADYRFNSFYEAFPRDTQWNVFTFPPDRFTSFPFGSLPTWSYRPIVAEVTVTPRDHSCQSVKSERALLAAADEGHLTLARAATQAPGDPALLGQPTPDRFLAWAMIDPGAAVVRVGQVRDVLEGGPVTGTSVQRYGWYGQFIVAYIDGGYVPVEAGPDVAGQPTKRMRTQRLYYPRSNVSRSETAPAAPGQLGRGYDVLQANRFEDGEAYSPVCEVFTYALPTPTLLADLPKDEAAILGVAGATLEPGGRPQSGAGGAASLAVVPRYVFCLQAAPTP